jgi:methionyl-tRNA formyltransferase
MRLVYCGTPVDAVAPLRALRDAGHEIALVLTQPDRRRGRGAATTASPVRAAATELGLPVLTPERAVEALDAVRDSGAALGVVVAFGQLLPTALLDALPLGFVNLHFSLLPRWRGAAPVERAVLAGDTETGVCLMRLEAGLDTGPVYARAQTSIGELETAGELRARLGSLGTELLVRELPTIAQHEPAPQLGSPTKADKVTVEEFRLDPRLDALALLRVVRAGNPRPGAWTVVAGHRLKILRAHVEAGTAPIGTIDAGARLGTAADLLVLDEVQPEGKSAMTAAAWRAGRAPAVLAIEPG